MLLDHFPDCPVCPVRNVGVLWPNSWMAEDATWYGRRPLPDNIVLHSDPVSVSMERGIAAPHFSSHVFCGYTVARLNNCWAVIFCLSMVTCRICQTVVPYFCIFLQPSSFATAGGSRRRVVNSTGFSTRPYYQAVPDNGTDASLV